jgi:hypothetical protein
LYEHHRKFDNASTEIDVSLAFCKICNETESDSFLKKYATWDKYVMSFREVRIRDRNKKGFLSPSIELNNGICYPDIQNVEPEQIGFYKARLVAASQFRLRSKYLNFLIEYGCKTERYKFAKMLCEESVNYLYDKPLSFDFSGVLERTIEIAKQFNMSDAKSSIKSLLHGKICNIEVSQEPSFGDDNHTTDIHNLSEILRNIKRNMNDFMAAETLNILLEKLKECKNRIGHGKDSFLRELLEWSRMVGYDTNELAMEYGEYYEHLANQSEQGHYYSAEFYKEALKVYLKYGIASKVAEMKSKIKKAQRDFLNSDEMIEIEHTIELPPESTHILNNFIKSYTHDVNTQNVEHYVWRLFNIGLLPRKNDCENASKIAYKNSIFFVMSKASIIQNGNSIAIESPEEKEEYILSSAYKQKLAYIIELYKHIWDHFVESGMCSDMICNFINEQEFISQNQKTIIAKGVDHLFSDDYISAIHILVPQFESAFRSFFEYYGCPTTSVTANASQKEQTLGEFLTEDFVTILSEDYLFSIKQIMVARFGLNLRNKIAHGLVQANELNKKVALVVLFLFMVLCNYKLVHNDTANNESEGTP